MYFGYFLNSNFLHSRKSYIILNTKKNQKLIWLLDKPKLPSPRVKKNRKKRRQKDPLVDSCGLQILPLKINKKGGKIEGAKRRRA